jgi:hypothetical protein
LNCNDYSMRPEWAYELAGISLLPRELRLEAIRKWLRRRPSVDLAEVLADFIGVANSVVANQRGLLELEAICRGLVHPHDAEKINFPTIFGALKGVELAQGIDVSKICGGCAFRLGTAANQSPCTTGDAADCVTDTTIFMCHEDVDEKGQAKHACPGYAQSKRQARRSLDVS